MPPQSAADALKTDLLSDIVAMHDSAKLWHIQGKPNVGKSTLLQELAAALRAEGMAPVLVRPPERAPDAGALAMIDTAAGLHVNGCIDDTALNALRSEDLQWSEKLDALSGWLEDNAEKAVLLCDDPEHWYYLAGEDSDHFRLQASAMIERLLHAPCHRVVTGQLDDRVRRYRRWQLEPTSAAHQYLLDSEAWGELADTAKAVAESGIGALERRSLLDVRLLVALAEARSVKDLVHWWGKGRERRELARQLVEALERHPQLKFLLPVWGKLSLMRRSADHDVLGCLMAPECTGRAMALLRHCLLHSEPEGRFRLPEPLKVDARAKRYWLSAEERTAAHMALFQFYRARFKGRAKDDGNSLIDECEAFHHAMHAGNPQLLEEARPFFATQLDILGRCLSRDHREYRQAAEVFQRAHRWEPEDAYAHHYRAYNLDILAENTPTVEAHYRRAIELEPDNTWWRSRWISYQITRGRMQESRNAWLEALDQFELPDSDAPVERYRHLHVWVARLLLHRGQLDMAEEVLQGIPDDIVSTEPGLSALKRRLIALLQARRGEAVFPLRILPEYQWQGPHLAPTRLEGHALMQWLPGRVDAVSEEAVDLHVAEPPTSEEEPRFGTVSMSPTQFDESSADAVSGQLQAGQFVELAWYEGKEIPVIRVHPAHELHDPDLPPLFPDPARYLRRSGWVA